MLISLIYDIYTFFHKSTELWDETFVPPDKIHAAEKSFGKARESPEPTWALLSCKVSLLWDVHFTLRAPLMLRFWVYLTYFFDIQLYRVTSGYSGSDLTSLAKDAALGPIRGA